MRRLSALRLSGKLLCRTFRQSARRQGIRDRALMFRASTGRTMMADTRCAEEELPNRIAADHWHEVDMER